MNMRGKTIKCAKCGKVKPKLGSRFVFDGHVSVGLICLSCARGVNSQDANGGKVVICACCGKHRPRLGGRWLHDNGEKSGYVCRSCCVSGRVKKHLEPRDAELQT